MVCNNQVGACCVVDHQAWLNNELRALGLADGLQDHLQLGVVEPGVLHCQTARVGHGAIAAETTVIQVLGASQHRHGAVCFTVNHAAVSASSQTTGVTRGAEVSAEVIEHQVIALTSSAGGRVVTKAAEVHADILQEGIFHAHKAHFDIYHDVGRHAQVAEHLRDFCLYLWVVVHDQGAVFDVGGVCFAVPGIWVNRFGDHGEQLIIAKDGGFRLRHFLFFGINAARRNQVELLKWEVFYRAHDVAHFVNLGDRFGVCFFSSHCPDDATAHHELHFAAHQVFHDAEDAIHTHSLLQWQANGLDVFVDVIRHCT